MNIDKIKYNEDNDTFYIKDDTRVNLIFGQIIPATIFLLIGLRELYCLNFYFSDWNLSVFFNLLLVLLSICVFLNLLFGKVSYSEVYPIDQVSSLLQKSSGKGERFCLKLSNGKVRHLGRLNNESEKAELKQKFSDRGVPVD